jgi:putative DNA primase/helicase
MVKTLLRGLAALDAHWADKSSEVFSMPAMEAWPRPTQLPQSLPPVPPFDSALLPANLRPWIMDITNRMQCPADFPAVGAIVAASSLIGARVVIRPKERDDWVVTPNLWGLIVGRPGVMKSPALAEVLKPLHRLEADERERWTLAHDQWQVDAKLTALRAADNEKKAKSLASKEPDAARALIQATEVPPEPALRRLIVNDATFEKYGDIMQSNPWGLLSYRDELHGLLSMMDKQGQEGARAFYLQAYDGDKGYTFDRITRGTVHVKQVCMAMIGGMQPGRLQDYVRTAVSGGRADDGLLQRFSLTVWPDLDGEFKNVDEFPDAEAREKAEHVFMRLANLPQAPDGEPMIWQFSLEAQLIFNEWRIGHERELRAGDLYPALESHLAKYRKLIPALALIFAMIDEPDGNQVIERPHLVRALAWGEHLRSHANRLYAAAIPETAVAATLLKKITAGQLDTMFTPRQAAAKCWTGLTTPDMVRKAAEVLIEYDWLRRVVRQTGGRPSEYYLVNPAALVQDPGDEQ